MNWTVCFANDADVQVFYMLIEADGFNVNPDGGVTFWKGDETVAYFSSVIYITKGPAGED